MYCRCQEELAVFSRSSLIVSILHRAILNIRQQFIISDRYNVIFYMVGNVPTGVIFDI